VASTKPVRMPRARPESAPAARVAHFRHGAAHARSAAGGGAARAVGSSRPASASLAGGSHHGTAATQDRPFQCQECLRTFRLQVHLEIHSRTHVRARTQALLHALHEAEERDATEADNELSARNTTTGNDAMNSPAGRSSSSSSQASPSQERCVICLDRRITHMLLPCEHASFCNS
jgi:hypothetical protein